VNAGYQRVQRMLRRDPLANPEPLIRRVYAYVAYRIGDGADAEDVTSQVFERALRYRESFDPRRGEPVSWLIGIARRCIAESFERATVTGPEAPEQVAPGDLESDSIRKLSLRAAMLELSARDRDFLALRYGADLSARQIAELFELQVNAVEVALHRALARLREHLEAAERPADATPAPAPRPEPKPFSG
jgi:RNA polymerase sigma factor (sigma-70 family)